MNFTTTSHRDIQVPLPYLCSSHDKAGDIKLSHNDCSVKSKYPIYLEPEEKKRKRIRHCLAGCGGNFAMEEEN